MGDRHLNVRGVKGLVRSVIIGEQKIRQQRKEIRGRGDEIRMNTSTPTTGNIALGKGEDGS